MGTLTNSGRDEVLCLASLLRPPGAGLPQKDVELQEKYENFFHLVDSFLWDSEDIESRMYRRGYMRMRRPRILTVYNNYGREEPSSVYRSFVDGCYDFLCWSGLNSLADSVARLG